MSAFGEGSLPSPERAVIEAHIDGCAECGELVADLARGSASGSVTGSDDHPTMFDGEPSTQRPVPARRPPLAERLGRYVLLERLGAGAMGEVFAAYDPELDRKVALKILRPDLRRGQSLSTGQARLLREAQTAASLTHPNVVTIYDVGSMESQVFIAMELVDGTDLRQWQRTAHPWTEVVEVYLQAGQGLAAAHDAELLHRDFKPDNALLGHDGTVRVLDFGLAKSTNEDSFDESSPSLSMRMTSEELTLTGTVLGTPAYMSPEQLLGQRLDARTDQFSYCVSLWEALHGTRPFIADSFEALRVAILKGEIEPPSMGRHVPAWLDRLLRRGLSVEPDRRHPSMRALLEQLRRGSGRRRRRMTVGALGAGFVAVAGLAYQGGRAEQAPSTAATTEPCRDAQAHVERVWSDERKAEIERGFAGTDAPFATTSWASVASAVDGYAERWQQGYQQACEATRVHETQSEELLDKRMACLDRRLGELDSLLTLFTTADSSLVSRAPRAAAGLPGVDACADTGTLDRQQPPPDDPDLRVAIQSARDRLSRARALALAARFKEAAAVADEVVTVSTDLGHAPLHANALLQQGDYIDRLGDPKRAAEVLREALVTAEVAGDDRAAASAWALLVYIEGVELGDAAQGRFMARYGEAKAERLSPDTDLRLSFLTNRGMMEYAAGDLDAANEHVRTAIALVEAERGPDSLSLTTLLDLQGSIHRVRGEREQSEASFRRALQLAETKLGPKHPAVANSHGNLAALYYSATRYDEALEHGQRALELFEALKTDSPFVAHALNNLANVHVARGDFEQALQMHERALALRETIFGRESPDVGMSLDGIGGALLAMGKASEALERHQQALEIRRKVHGDDNPVLYYSHHGMGEALLALGRAEEALEPLERALSLRDTPEPADPLELGEAELALARALVATKGDRARARTLIDRASEHLAGDSAHAEALEAVERDWKRGA
ncbi:MAG: tetratricopeptide repeat protein [Myxococcota bacterium]